MSHVPVFHGRVTRDAKFDPAEHERDKRRTWLMSLAGQDVEFVVRKIRTKRSLDQNAYLHAKPFTLLADYWGEDMESAKLLVLGEWSGWRETVGGNRIPMKPSSSALTTEEASQLIEWIPPWAMREFGVHVPLPNEAD